MIVMDCFVSTPTVVAVPAAAAATTTTAATTTATAAPRIEPAGLDKLVPGAH